MKIIEAIKEKQRNLRKSRQPVIAFLGDSVTQGCFDLYMQGERLKPYTISKHAYHEKVKDIFAMFYPEVPVTIVNAGISGDTAKEAKERLERDVLSFKPDLVVVCFGLNDASLEENGLCDYVNALESNFEGIRNEGCEVIFMTPCLRTSKADLKRFEERFNEVAEMVAKNENDGWLLKYLDGARELCEKMNIPVCDCNELWLKLKENEVDINKLLSNHINHPTEKMHWMFAYELVRTMFYN
jgi:lysophospholipase L1-like esterase